MVETLKVAMVAGEASGDLLAGLLLDGLKARWPGLQAAGIAGPNMQRRGMQAWWPSDMLAVRGYVEVLRHYRKIVGVREQLRARLLADQPDIFVGVDAPDFNLDLEAGLKQAGIPVVHFVAPSVWAWRPQRIQKIRQSVDHVLCIFPFEPELLAKHGIESTFVGHPLARVIPMTPDIASARAELGLSADERVVAVLPGSRASEIRYLAPRFLAAVRRMHQRRPDVQFILPTLPAFQPGLVQMAAQEGVSDVLTVVSGKAHLALAACDVTLIASGTATLEAALFKRPMVIAYNMNYLSWQIMKRQKLQPWVGLPNILCREFIVPELLQKDATPEALAAETMAWLDEVEAVSPRVERLRQTFFCMHKDLQRDTPQLAADAIQRIIKK